MTDEETPIDVAFRAHEADPDAPAPRLRFHERLLGAELFVLLEAEPEPGRLRPRIFDLEAGRFAAAFDTNARLAAFLDAPAPYAALGGRRLVAALAGRDLGLALNPGVAPSATLLTAAEIDWLATMAAPGGEAPEARVRGVEPPTGADPALIVALGPRLTAMRVRFEAAWLCALRLDDGRARLALAIAGAPPEAQDAIAATIAEAVRFSAADATGLDVTFLAPDVTARAAFERVGLRFEPPPEPAHPAPPAPPRGPGLDPDRPPRLR